MITGVMVMAARGVGPEIASRILEVSYLNEDDLIRRLLNAETDFAKKSPVLVMDDCCLHIFIIARIK